MVRDCMSDRIRSLLSERILTGGFKAGAGPLVTNLQNAGGGSDDCALILLWRT